MLDVTKLRSLTREDLAALGVGQVAYVRPVTIDGMQAYSIHAANGQAMGAVASSTAAFAAIRQNDLELATLQ